MSWIVRAMCAAALGAGLVASAGCPGGARPKAVAAPVGWEVLQPTGTAVALYRYDEPIAAYAPEDRGAYVVRVRGEVEARHAAAVALGVGDDVVGDDGYVVRRTAAEVAALTARAEVLAVSPLQAVDRRGVLVDTATELPEVRIELFADASADEVAAIAAWVSWRGGQVLWRGPTAVRARVPHEARTEAGQLSIVRWIE